MTLIPDDGPTAAVGNLRFTRHGVYADYLLSGLPFIFLSREAQDRVADVHAELLRALPSGALLSGLTVPVTVRTLSRRMIYAHPDVHPETVCAGAPLPADTERWVQHCRRWAPALGRGGSRRRIHWLSLPLDYGLAGATTAGGWQRRWEAVVGRDKDTDMSLAHYRDLAATMVAKLPPVLFAKPASAEQIWWHWNYTASRHAWQHPLPSAPYDPQVRLPASAFTPVWRDLSAAALRGRRWRAARSDADIFLRTYRDPGDSVPDSYQVIAGLEKYPDAGLRWPQATIFKVLDDLTTPATTLDWTIHLTFDTAETAVALAHNVITNIKDQARQRGRHADSDDELYRKLASGRQLASALKQGSAERGVNAAVVVTAAATDPASADTAITEVIRRYRSQKLELTRRRGGQATLWRALNPGTETAATLHEVRNPSTANAFAKFVPLLATSLGNNVGVPLGYTITSPGLREIVLNDLIGAPGRDNPANLVIGGSPGRGKSQCAKNLVRSWLEMGAGMHLIDPTEAREHQTALSTFDDDRKLIIDATRPRFSLDGLRIFPFDEAGERTVDHLLPQLGFSALSAQAARLKGLLGPASRHSNGIGSLNQLIGFLQARPADRVGVDDDLLIALEGLRAERLLAPMFDDSLPPPDLSRQLVIWNFGGLKLPTVTEEYRAHLHHQTTPRQRAAQALYGMAAELAQSLFFSRDTQPDILVVEECAAWTHSPGGQRCANTIIRQGRKAWTLFVGISQSPRTDFGVLEDEFIEQRICLGFKYAGVAEDTLRWCNRDLQRHPGLLTDYVTNTSPAAMPAYGDDAIDDRHGKVIPGREGEAWLLDELGGWGKVRLFSAPTYELAQLYDTNPQRKRARLLGRLSG
jgi:tRNA threonylcarbamoyladenosine modification (KEOPS) complex Cgi121 subunit